VPGEPWSPGLADVARHVPTRTRDSKSPGSDKLLGTFNANTTPTDGIVQQMIDDTVAGLEAQVGDLPYVTQQHPDVAVAMRTYVEWRVAADIELAYPNRDADIQTAAALDARANKALAVVTAALVVTDEGSVAADPVWAFPDPPPYADSSPGSGAEFIFGVNGGRVV
jgi:hypothetical protein